MRIVIKSWSDPEFLAYCHWLKAWREEDHPRDEFGRFAKKNSVKWKGLSVTFRGRDKQEKSQENAGITWQEAIECCGIEAAKKAGDFNVIVRFQKNAVEIELRGEKIQAIRIFSGAEIENELLVLDDSVAGQGIGEEMLREQVEAAYSAGFRRITMYAARDDEAGLIGHKVWPRLGFDGPIPDHVPTAEERGSEKVLRKNEKSGRVLPRRKYWPKKFREYKTVGQLYNSKDGADWWAKHGEGLHLEFNLTEGSESWDKLDARQEK